ncbi:MAG: SIMPL domain-containing protein, partial [Gemmatimonadetes bacterium]|nr:SIMPL domain-containing protein [Gemmatimonadota bacterium]
MRRRLLLRTAGLSFALFVVALLATPNAHAQEDRRITVTGEADVRVVPDEVVLTLGVETDDLDLAAAKAQNDERMSRVIAAGRDAGLPDNLIRTDYLGIEPRYDYDGRERIFLGYWVQKSVSLTLRDIDAFEDLLSAVLEAGANYVHGIQFRTTELRLHRDRARSLALEAAREKAEMMAAELGHTLAGTVLIREDRSGWWSSYGGW